MLGPEAGPPWPQMLPFLLPTCGGHAWLSRVPSPRVKGRRRVPQCLLLEGFFPG